MLADPKSLERQVRQALADKISGNQIGIWLLLPEHLRLGTWDLMHSWSGLPTDRVEPRLALHLVNEAAMCLCSHRQGRTLSQKGFELANGLPFVPTDLAIHDLLQSHTFQRPNNSKSPWVNCAVREDISKARSWRWTRTA